MVHDEQRLLLALIRETGQVVRYEQQHVHLSFLKDMKEIDFYLKNVCVFIKYQANY